MRASNILENLFGSPIKAKALKLFLRNPERSFTVAEAAKHLKVRPRGLASEVRKLLAIGLLHKRQDNVLNRSKRRRQARQRTVFSFNPAFPFGNELRNLILKSSPTAWEKRLGELRKIGRVKLLLACGAFLGEERARIDLLIVGDGLVGRRVHTFVKNLEADIGKELQYVILGTKEFIYRYRMFDNFVRDVLEQPHQMLINRLQKFLKA